MVSLGAALIDISGGFRRDTTARRYKSDVDPTLVPHLFVNRLMGRMALGLGVYVPYGLTSQWHSDFPGRFEAQRASLKTFYVQPNIAYAVDA